MVRCGVVASCRRVVVVVVVVVWSVLPILLPLYTLNVWWRGVGGEAVRGGVVSWLLVRG